MADEHQQVAPTIDLESIARQLQETNGDKYSHSRAENVTSDGNGVLLSVRRSITYETPVPAIPGCIAGVRWQSERDFTTSKTRIRYELNINLVPLEQPIDLKNVKGAGAVDLRTLFERVHENVIASEAHSVAVEDRTALSALYTRQQ